MTGPGAGHEFHFSVTTRGSYTVVGDPQHHDADWVGEPLELTVRAWDLPAACRVAAETPLSEWSWDQ